MRPEGDSFDFLTVFSKSSFVVLRDAQDPEAAARSSERFTQSNQELLDKTGKNKSISKMTFLKFETVQRLYSLQSEQRPEREEHLVEVRPPSRSTDVS